MGAGRLVEAVKLPPRPRYGRPGIFVVEAREREERREERGREEEVEEAGWDGGGDADGECDNGDEGEEEEGQGKQKVFVTRGRWSRAWGGVLPS